LWPIHASAHSMAFLSPHIGSGSIVDQNPLVWMAKVNGFLVDLREMPREFREIAFANGLIRYIPADRG
jgi:hypothetical protein